MKKQTVLKDFPTSEEIYEVSEAMKNLGDPSRLKIFWVLCHTEENVQGIADIVNMSSPAVSHHLRLLKDNRLITPKRVGKEMYYKASDTAVVKKMHEAIETIAEIRCPR